MHTTVILVAGLLSALGVWCMAVPHWVLRFVDRVYFKRRPSQSADARELMVRLLAGAWIGLVLGAAITVIR